MVKDGEESINFALQKFDYYYTATGCRVEFVNKPLNLEYALQYVPDLTDKIKQINRTD